MSTDPRFRNVPAPQEYDTFTFPKHILYDENLTGNAVKILLIMLDYGKRPGWQLRQTHLISMAGMGYSAFSSAMKILENANYVRRKRFRVDGKLSAYEYQFSAFPIFDGDIEENEPTPPFEPVAIFKFRKPSLENRSYTFSKTNALVETTNPENECKKNSLVGSPSLKELEKLNLSNSQKSTLYKKFTHEQILKGILAIDVNTATSVFALLYKAITEDWEPREAQDEQKAAKSVLKQAEEYLEKRGITDISIGVDKKNAYVYWGTSCSTYALNSKDFKEKFSEGLNSLVKRI